VQAQQRTLQRNNVGIKRSNARPIRLAVPEFRMRGE
jgi:hypothetical protein